MSSCSTTSPQLALPVAPPPVHAPAPMLCDGVAAPPTPGSPCAAGDAAGGQHHLLRHVLSPEQCSDALHHFGTTDSKAAARMVNRMSQRELRDMFAKVYNVHTNSNNNTWLRRKLLEAVGASRRFYAAANRTGRPKQRRAPADGGAALAPKPRTPKAAPALLACAPQHCSQRSAAQHHHHHAMAPGPALPAGSPRALAARRRSAAAAGSAAGLADAAHASHPAPRHHYLLCSGSRLAPSRQSSEGGEALSEGSEAHPRALAPHAPLDAGLPSGSGTPTSAFAAARAPSYRGLHASPHPPAIPCSGSRSSLQSSQLAGPTLAPRLSSWGPGPAAPGAPAAVGSDGKLPYVGSFSTLTALLGGGPPPHPSACPPGYAPAPTEPLVAPLYGAAGATLRWQPAQQLAPVQQGLGCDLGVGLWVPADAGLGSLGPAPGLGMPGLDDDWLTWDEEWQLPALF